MRFYWLHCREDVEKWCRLCDSCTARKGPRVKGRGPLQKYNVGAPFERMAVDILGPLPTTERGNRYLLVAQDYFTKWPEVIPVPNQEAVTVAGALVEHVFSRFGVPLELHSDQGRNFEATLFQEVAKILGMRKTRTTALHPQSDGMVERLNRTLEQYLAIFVDDNQRDWDSKVPLFLLAYRSAVHESTRVTPSRMLFGKELRLPGDLLFGRPMEETAATTDYASQLRQKMTEIHEFARRHLKVCSDRMKTRYDRGLPHGTFHEGQLVWLYNPQRRKGYCPKLQKNWEGPYRVLKQINDVVYRICRQGSRAKPKVVHIDRLALYEGPDVEESVRDEQT
ncbi:DDE-type integrase/transposase/recombinase [Salmonella enterica]|nr:DDE-type integrase/transposase/recombinase [Salmonella enterica]